MLAVGFLAAVISSLSTVASWRYERGVSPNIKKRGNTKRNAERKRQRRQRFMSQNGKIILSQGFTSPRVHSDKLFETAEAQIRRNYIKPFLFTSLSILNCIMQCA